MGSCHFTSFCNKIDSPRFQKESFINQNLGVQIKCHTWNKESYNLYDYENKNITQQIFRLTESGILQREGNEIFLTNGTHVAGDKINLLKVLFKSDGILLKSFSENKCPFGMDISMPERENQGENTPWIVCKHHQENIGYPVKEGTVLRFGRMKFKVLEIFFQQLAPKPSAKEKKAWKISRSNVSQMGTPHEKTSHSILKENNKNGSADEDEKPNSVVCRICLSETVETDNPFVNPCACAGSMKYSHLKCLQLWFNSQIQEKKINENCIQYTWKNFNCELCKQEIPWTITVGKAKYELISLNKPFEDHVVLEALSKDPNKTNEIYILNFKGKNPLMIGRSNDCDFKISDISVSRVHALLKNYKNMELYIEDCQSKFGTLIFQRKCFPLQFMGETYSMQIGRSFIQVCLYRLDRSIGDICCNKTRPSSNKNEIMLGDVECLEDDKSFLEELKPYNEKLATSKFNLEFLDSHSSFQENTQNILDGPLGSEREERKDEGKSGADDFENNGLLQFSEENEEPGRD